MSSNRDKGPNTWFPDSNFLDLIWQYLLILSKVLSLFLGYDINRVLGILYRYFFLLRRTFLFCFSNHLFLGYFLFQLLVDYCHQQLILLFFMFVNFGYAFQLGIFYRFLAFLTLYLQLILLLLYLNMILLQRTIR